MRLGKGMGLEKFAADRVGSIIRQFVGGIGGAAWCSESNRDPFLALDYPGRLKGLSCRFWFVARPDPPHTPTGNQERVSRLHLWLDHRNFG
jgi:hypothetical protein